MKPPQSIVIGGKTFASFFVGTGGRYTVGSHVHHMVRQPEFERMLKAQPVEIGAVFAPRIETIEFQEASLEDIGIGPDVGAQNFRVLYMAFGHMQGRECPIHLALHLWRETQVVGRVLQPVVSCGDGTPRIFEISEKDGVRRLSAVKFRAAELWPRDIPVIYKTNRPK